MLSKCSDAGLIKNCEIKCTELEKNNVQYFNGKNYH
jgi:hypothetical protein